MPINLAGFRLATMTMRFLDAGPQAIALGDTRRRIGAGVAARPSTLS